MGQFYGFANFFWSCLCNDLYLRKL